MDYKERVREAYKKHRANNLAALEAMIEAKHDVMYGPGSLKRKVIDDLVCLGMSSIEVELPFDLKLTVKINDDSWFHGAPWEHGAPGGIVRVCSAGRLPRWAEDWILPRRCHYYSNSIQHFARCWRQNEKGNRYYDWKATLPHAIAQGWDAPPYLSGDRYGRAIRAIRAQYVRWRMWCDGVWSYVGYRIDLYKDGELIDLDSCSGFQSDYMDWFCRDIRSKVAWMLLQARRKFLNEKAHLEQSGVNV